MATKHAPDYGMKPLHMSAYGNAWSEDYSITDKSGAADKLVLGAIPAGIRVHSMRLINGAAGATATVKVGFEPMDADGPTASDAAFFATGTSVATAGAKESAFQPVTFNSPVRIVVTAEVAFANSAALTLVVNGKVVGIP